MADNNDDILSLQPEPDNNGSGNGAQNTGGGSPNAAPRVISKKNNNDGESLQKRLYKRLPFLLLFIVAVIVVVLFIAKDMISSGISSAVDGHKAAQKTKPLAYNSQQESSEISSIQKILQEQQENQAKDEAKSTAPKTAKDSMPKQHAGPSGAFGPGIPGGAADNASLAAKASQIASSPLVALRGHIEKTNTSSTQTGYAPNSPQAIQQQIKALQAEKQAAYKSYSDNNLGIGKAEKLALETAGLSGGKGNSAESENASDSQWQKQNAGKAGYGSVIPTLPKLQGVALYPGAIIPAETITRLNTQTPGQITAQVTRTVYSNSGVIAIPAGSRLIGKYDGQVFDGQNRVMMSFSRVIFPGGKEVSLQGMNATGPRGSSGVDGNVHTHFWTSLGSSLLVALITDGVDSIPNPNNSTTGNTYIGGGSSPTQAGAQVMQQQANNLLSPYTNVKPTITLPPATPLRIMVNKTILLPTG